MPAAGESVLGHAGAHLLARAEAVDSDLALVVAAVRDQDAVLQVHERLRGDAVDRAGRRDQYVRVGQRLLERADAMAVHVRLERRDRVDLDHGDASAGAAGRPREPLADPAVADDAELAAREVKFVSRSIAARVDWPVP